MAASVAQPAPPRWRSIAARVIDRIVIASGVIPYALVALVLRLIMAGAFFVSGQAAVVGPEITFSFRGLNFSLILPAQVRDDVLDAYATQFATVPISSVFIANGFAFAEFLLPIYLVIGVGTRIVALVLLIMTIVLQIYIAPEALWTTHVYWLAILLTLMAGGAGAISLDWLISHFRKLKRL